LLYDRTAAFSVPAGWVLTVQGEYDTIKVENWQNRKGECDENQENETTEEIQSM
jgi:hypothetical protein